jgi:predicted DNA-binding transcriptional regulator AlpA
MLKLAELASMFRVSELTIRRGWLKGTFPRPIRVGAALRWPREVIDRWVKDQMNESVEDDA